MIEVFIEVVDEAAPFTLAVKAESLQEAVGVAKERYPGTDVRVVFPISPEEFFVKDAGVAGLGRLDVPEEVAW